MTPTSRSRSWLSVAFACAVLAFSSGAKAQASTLDLEAHALPEAGAGPRVEVPAPTAASRAVPWNAKRANRGAFLAGFGAGTALVSTTAAVAFGRSDWCYDRDPSYPRIGRYWGSVAAGLGGAIAITGMGLLFSQRRSVRVAHRAPNEPGIHTPGKGALGFALGILASGVLVLIPSSIEGVVCTNS